MKVLWTTWCKPKPLRQAHWRVETLTAAFPAGMIAGLQSRNFQFPDSILMPAKLVMPVSLSPNLESLTAAIFETGATCRNMARSCRKGVYWEANA